MRHSFYETQKELHKTEPILSLLENGMWRISYNNIRTGEIIDTICSYSDEEKARKHYEKEIKEYEKRTI